MNAADSWPCPADMTECDQFVLYRAERINGRFTKVPYATSGRKASSTDSRTWASFEAVLAVLKAQPGRYSGIGFVFEESNNFTFIDVDHCLDAEQNLAPCVTGLVERFSDSFMEVSPSGTGLHIFVRGRIPTNLPGILLSESGVSIEMYSRARYATLTGRIFRGAPLQLEDHAADLARIYERLTSGKQKTWPLQPLQGGRIQYGHQHSTLVSIAGTLRARRVCDEAILACLMAINRYECERPGSADAISRIVQSTRQWGKR